MRGGGRRAALLCGPRAAGRRVLARLHPILVGRWQPDPGTLRTAGAQGRGPYPEGRLGAGVTAMQTIPIWLQTAFAEWISGQLYLDGRGNYRSRPLGRRIVPYNRPLKRLYPDNAAFHRA